MPDRTDAFLDLVEPLLPQLHGMAQHYGRTPGDAHDLVQETLLRAWRGFRPGAAQIYRPAWLFVILRRVAIDWRRKHAARIRALPVADVPLTDLADDAPAAAPSIPGHELHDQLDQRLAAAIAALPPAYREVLLLSVVGDLAYAEIAAALGCPLGTVMSRIGRARQLLRQRLADLSPASMEAEG